MNTQSDPSPLPALEAVIAAFDDRRDWMIVANGSKLRSEYGLLALVPLLVEALPKIRNAAGRMHIMFDLIPLARRDARVVEAAKDRLQDRSRGVRMHACEVLAYSLRHDAIPSLEPLLHHPDAETRATAAAAIDAIQHQNHHFYLDRQHKGTSFWVVNPQDDPAYKPRPWQIRQESQ
jgi:HEAT repeat protein